jgi:hypothetical protein
VVIKKVVNEELGSGRVFLEVQDLRASYGHRRLGI